ncbi:hypothetical protein KTC92_07600 [Clostridium sp. CM027]|uniref:hypothetical protein n=1 Tax=Clostridium sp. CM027 TaxID=2849865 RepID=UPI001C6F261F|nr:hypothetical protein [Clostridium sp. CM027]MBW9146608.1 hypothetical protein [Clostridium sp. CM027]UVE42288.1 hypothetical protein KTC92_07600 [Clostridium sp. CM027]
MNKKQFSNIFLLCLAGGFFMLGNKLGIIAYGISSISLIIWAIIFINKKEKKD